MCRIGAQFFQPTEIAYFGLKIFLPKYNRGKNKEKKRKWKKNKKSKTDDRSTS